MENLARLTDLERKALRSATYVYNPDAFEAEVERILARRLEAEHDRGVRAAVGWVAEGLASAWQQSTDSNFLVILQRLQDAAARDVAAWLAEGEG